LVEGLERLQGEFEGGEGGERGEWGLRNVSLIIVGGESGHFGERQCGLCGGEECGAGWVGEELIGMW